MKSYLALLSIALPMLANGQTAGLVGERMGMSANGEAVKICTYVGPQQVQLLVAPYASCPPSLGGPPNYTGGYSSAINAQSQRAVQDAQTKLLESQTKAIEAQIRALEQANAKGQQGVSSNATIQQQGDWAEQWTRWLRQSLDMCDSILGEGRDVCKKAAKSVYADATACNAGDRNACSEKEKDLAEFQRWDPEKWAAWLKQSLDYCGTNERCQQVATRSYSNHLECRRGNHDACGQSARDIADWSAEKRAP